MCPWGSPGITISPPGDLLDPAMEPESPAQDSFIVLCLFLVLIP